MKARCPIDWTLFYATVALAILGATMVYSTSSLLAEQRFGSHLYFIKRQIIWFAISAGMMAVIIRLDLKRLGQYTPLAIIGVIVTLAVVFLMPARNGSHRWLFLGPFALQPSELAKIILLYYLAHSLSRADCDIRDYRKSLLPHTPLIGLILALIMLEPDLGSVIVLGLTVLTVFYMAGARVLHMGAAIVPLALGGSFLVFGLSYKIDRIKSYLASLSDPLQGSYQVKQAILALGAGGFWGAGLGDGRQKHFFLPYPHTDFIFAATGEELGFLGLLFALGLYAVILYRGLKIASYQPDRFGYLLASGVTLCLFFNVAINIGVVTSLIPTTGLPLPLMSYGGSSLLVSLLSIGILLNLSQRRDGWCQ